MRHRPTAGTVIGMGGSEPAPGAGFSRRVLARGQGLSASRRFERARQIAALDVEQDTVAIARLLAFHEFPWDTEQALSLALFRTFAVPTIGSLLDRTGEFTERTQKRYDDTALLLDGMLRNGMDDGDGREALRRMNRMHAAHPISNDDLRYVLSTFVITPVRWNARYGWRRLTPHEIAASVVYYRRLGALMGIKDVPADYAGFERLHDGYEREHFAFDPGGRRVADATLDLMASWYPRPLRGLVRRASIAMLDPHLVDAFGYPRVPAWERAAVAALLRARGGFVRLLPPRDRPRYATDSPNIRSYPRGFDVRTLGTFPDRPAGSPSPSPP
jgi:ER-bound oxygenase mpaB/B'/Rubber oxygenase, catalytic domain